MSINIPGHQSTSIGYGGKRSTDNVEQRTTLTINILSTTSSTTVQLPVQFVPDEVIVRQILYYTQNDYGYMYQIWTDLIDEQILGSFLPYYSTSPSNTHFILKKPMTRAYKFEVQTPTRFMGAGTPVPLDNMENVSIVLEFVKYR